jgi:hypothetical protein
MDGGTDTRSGWLNFWRSENEMRDKATEVLLLMETVAAFVDKMENKLIAKVAEGSRGWDDPECIPNIRKLLAANLAKGDSEMVDVANLAMMLWYHWRLSPESQDG